MFHKAFGDGLIVSVKPMGGDALLEIAFDQKGTKRLMAKSADSLCTKFEIDYKKGDSLRESPFYIVSATYFGC